MNFKIKTDEKKTVNYKVRSNGIVESGKTTLSAAKWILKQGTPYESNEFEGFPIAVRSTGGEYFFEGKVRGECGPDYCDV